MYLGRVVEEGTAQDVIERPGHPYTRALVAAVPGAGRRGKRRALPRGELPDAANIPRGCRFHPRCPQRFEPCDSEDPPFFAASGAEDHRAACLLLSSQPAARP
jgi:oligopeptide/dipeptide ABC transporter ATP-binding protein